MLERHLPLCTRELMRFLFLLAILSLGAGACHMINQKLGLKDDNVLESISEDLIESQLRIDMDLTPNNVYQPTGGKQIKLLLEYY